MAYSYLNDFLRPPTDLFDEKSVAVWLNTIFNEIRARFGEQKAIQMFAVHTRRLTNKDATVWKNAGLIWRLLHMDEPNISALAREQAGEGKNSAKAVEAWRQQIHVALKDKKAIAEARRIWEDWYDSKFDDYFHPPKPRTKHPKRRVVR
jgi:hypothetical protein